jgi:hypothetical protein
VVRQHRPNERDDNRCLLVSEGNGEVGWGRGWPSTEPACTATKRAAREGRG